MISIKTIYHQFKDFIEHHYIYIISFWIITCLRNTVTKLHSQDLNSDIQMPFLFLHLLHLPWENNGKPHLNLDQRVI